MGNRERNYNIIFPILLDTHGLEFDRSNENHGIARNGLINDVEM